jgi:hypothetical protein
MPAGRGDNAQGFVVEHYANFGTGEPWVARLMLGLQELVFVVPAFAETHQDFMNELGEVFEALGMAFEELRALRKLVAEGAPVIEVTKTYETLYGHLWRAFRDRFPPAMKALGLDLGFTYKNDKQFEKGAAGLLARRPELSDLVDLMRRDRADFQNRLAEYRNRYLEHRKRRVDPNLLADFHHPGSAKNTFENVWQAIEDHVVLYVIANLPPGFHVVEIPEEERDPTRPTRFRVAVEGLPPSAGPAADQAPS